MALLKSIICIFLLALTIDEGYAHEGSCPAANMRVKVFIADENVEDMVNAEIAHIATIHDSCKILGQQQMDYVQHPEGDFYKVVVTYCCDKFPAIPRADNGANLSMLIQKLI